MRRGRIAAGVVGLVAVGSLGLAGCFGPAPPAAPQVSSCASAGDATPNGAASISNAIAECHKQIHGGYVNSSGLAQTAKVEVAKYAGKQCVGGVLQHTQSVYAENLYCWWNGTSNCPSSALGAKQAINGWMNSAGHRANIDGHGAVGAAVICNSGHYFAAAHYQ